MAKDVERPTLRRRIARWRRAMSPRPQNEDVATIIRDSGLFDADWYLERYPDIADAGLDPLEHYATHGGMEGRKASPRFDGRWYSERYPDVVASGLHPLVHYVRFGQGRETIKRVGLTGVKTVESDFVDAAELLSSPLFDATWYSRQQKITVSSEQAALHYLKIGAAAGQSPGPRFDGTIYESTYPDVRHAKINPLLHFIRYGETEGRKIAPASIRPIEAPLSLARRKNPPLARPVSDIDWTTADKLRPRAGRALVEVFGVGIGTIVEVFEDATAPLADSLREALATLATLHRCQAAEIIGVRGRRGRRTLSDLTHVETRPAPALVDAWFVNDGTLRARVHPASNDRVSRLYQCDLEGRLQLVGEALVRTGDMTLIDCRLLNPFLPVLLVHCALDGDLIGGEVLPFPSLLRGGVHSAELEASGFAASNATRRHALEARLIQAANVTSAESSESLQAIEVDLTGAHGAERIFSQTALAWLTWLGIEVREAEGAGSQANADHLVSRLAKLGRPMRPRAAGRTLYLAPNGLPALGALYAQAVRPGVGAFLVADLEQPTPRWMVSPPMGGEAFDDLQLDSMPCIFPRVLGAPSAASTAGLGPLAILFQAPARTTDAQLTFPIAPDASGPLLKRGLTSRQRARTSIAALVVVRERADSVAVVRSLARQSLAASVRVILMVKADWESVAALRCELEQCFPGRHDLLEIDKQDDSDAIALAIQHAGSAEMLLLAHPRIDLHDTRTLETLYVMASHKRVATAGCLMVREGGFREGRLLEVQSAGLYPSQVSLLNAPTLMFRAPETSGALPLGTYSVVGNDVNLMMIPRRVWDKLGGELGPIAEGAYAIDFSLRALSSGLSHVCTSAVSATDLDTERTGFRGDIPAVGDMRLRDWADVLDRTTILRALN